MRLRLPSCVLAAALVPGLAFATTVPESLSLDSLVGVFPSGTASPFTGFSSTAFNSANTPYTSGSVGMVVTFNRLAATPSLVASGADGSNTTGFDNTPATVTLAASGNALIASNAVPEPATLALLCAGLFGVMAVRRRRA